jgi:hypothetical protein
MQIEKLKEVLVFENVVISKPVSDEDIMLFQSKNNVLLPKDLVKYFKCVNGTNEEYDNRFVQFYSLNQFKSIDEELKNWSGLPDYSGIVNTLKEYDSYFVIADYFFHMFVYAIHLSDNNNENEVLVISGDQYKKIANNFSQFIDLYLSESMELSI